MIIRYTTEEFSQAKSKDFLKLECYVCHEIFLKRKKLISMFLKKTTTKTHKFCSKECSVRNQTKKVKVNCKQCNNEFLKSVYQLKKIPNSFCNSSCAAKYNNTHKTKGYRRSKLEFYIEKQLKLLYPTLEIHFNRKDTINSELDVYIPSLKLAFELNGIFYYEPIFGPEKLSNIQNNDNRKFQACLEKGIELCIIDTSKQVYFKDITSKRFLDIITNIINVKIGPAFRTSTEKAFAD